MLRKEYYLPIIFILILVAQGCASWGTSQFVDQSQRPEQYERFFNELDAAVDQAGVRNAAFNRVSGFPYLRANRFLVAVKERLKTDDQKQQWVRWLQQLDVQARATEIQNLPLAAVAKLTAADSELPDRKVLQERVISYSNKLLTHDQLQPNFYEALQTAVQNSSEYSTVMQVFGLYPITVIPVAVVTEMVFDEMAAWHQLPPEELATLGRLTAYAPARAMDYSQEAIQQILIRSKQNPLEIPLPSAADRQTLLAVFAPIIIQDVAADYDKIGEVVWDQKQIKIHSGNAVAYYYLSHAFFKKEPILQINYVFWFSARNGPRSPRIERGSIDGLTVRVSLGPDGSPFMVDIMNNCGCYHFYVPRKELVKEILPVPMAIDAFVPTWLPDNFPRQRLVIRLKSGWHQVEHVGTDDMSSRSISYRLIAYKHLEKLPRFDHANESMFTSTGIGKNSERIEPIIFFPMGIPDIGSMRQRGHHAIKFVGRAHFDDPHLFDEHFHFN
ncbi:MAG: hypothetical protein PVI71_13530 [Desulfobacterales bacterium]